MSRLRMRLTISREDGTVLLDITGDALTAHAQRLDAPILAGPVDEADPARTPRLAEFCYLPWLPDWLPDTWRPPA